MTKSLPSLFTFLLCGGGMGVYRRCSAGSSRMIQNQTTPHLSPALYSLITCSKGFLVTLCEARAAFFVSQTAAGFPFLQPQLLHLCDPCYCSLWCYEARSLYSSTKRSLLFCYSPQSSFLVGYESIFKYSIDLPLKTNKLE